MKRETWRRLGCVGLLLAMLWACSEETASRSAATRTVVVRRGPLLVTVIEGGDLSSGKPHIVRSQVDGENAITFLAPEGEEVKKGELIVELDRSNIEDALNQAERDVTLARSEVERASAAVEIQKKLNKENEIAAGSAVELAVKALEAYKADTFPLLERELLSELTIAKEKLARAQDKADASKRLFEQTFISKTELEADQLARNQARENVDIVTKRLAQLREWTQRDDLKRLQTDVEVNKLAKARVDQENQSRLRQRRTTLDSARQDHALRVEARDRLKSQLAACRIVSPADGLVVYARRRRRWGRSDPIDLGREVYKRQELMRVPDLSDLQVEVDIHESTVKKVAVGQDVTVVIDAIAHRRLPGKVLSVSPVPSSSSSWTNSGVKVYSSIVKLLEVPSGLKPGMHAQVEILVREAEDVLQVPLAAVQQAGRRTFAYVKKGEGSELREIDVGDHGKRNVEILSGLVEGDEVYLSKPPGGDALPLEDPLPSLPPAKGPPEGEQLPNTGADPSEDKRARFRKYLENMTPAQRARFEKMRREGRFGGRGGKGRGGGGRRGRGGRDGRRGR